eukprot:GHVL01044638.1.p1 GENE.GHVL01044638.1~~GHVL01044638.1.p1  ORF type:complete len:739 (+),score=138.46 GHVL01044638.1:1468-3684(+)
MVTHMIRQHLKTRRMPFGGSANLSISDLFIDLSKNMRVTSGSVNQNMQKQSINKADWVHEDNERIENFTKEYQQEKRKCQEVDHFLLKAVKNYAQQFKNLQETNMLQGHYSFTSSAPNNVSARQLVAKIYNEAIRRFGEDYIFRLFSPDRSSIEIKRRLSILKNNKEDNDTVVTAPLGFRHYFFELIKRRVFVPNARKHKGKVVVWKRVLPEFFAPGGKTSGSTNKQIIRSMQPVCTSKFLISHENEDDLGINRDSDGRILRRNDCWRRKMTESIRMGIFGSLADVKECTFAPKAASGADPKYKRLIHSIPAYDWSGELTDKLMREKKDVDNRFERSYKEGVYEMAKSLFRRGYLAKAKLVLEEGTEIMNRDSGQLPKPRIAIFNLEQLDEHFGMQNKTKKNRWETLELEEDKNETAVADENTLEMWTSQEEKLKIMDEVIDTTDKISYGIQKRVWELYCEMVKEQKKITQMRKNLIKLLQEKKNNNCYNRPEIERPKKDLDQPIKTQICDKYLSSNGGRVNCTCSLAHHPSELSFDVKTASNWIQASLHLLEKTKDFVIGSAAHREAIGGGWKIGAGGPPQKTIATALPVKNLSAAVETNRRIWKSKEQILKDAEDKIFESQKTFRQFQQLKDKRLSDLPVQFKNGSRSLSRARDLLIESVEAVQLLKTGVSNTSLNRQHSGLSGSHAVRGERLIKDATDLESEIKKEIFRQNSTTKHNLQRKLAIKALERAHSCHQ